MSSLDLIESIKRVGERDVLVFPDALGENKSRPGSMLPRLSSGRGDAGYSTDEAGGGWNSGFYDRPGGGVQGWGWPESRSPTFRNIA